MPKFLDDNDVLNLTDMGDAVELMESAFRQQAAGTYVAPARHQVHTDPGRLVFTIGAAPEVEQVIGFRVYGVFPGGDYDESDQLVVVYSTDTGKVKGIISGGQIGAHRTGAINGVATKYLARENATVLSVIGAGFQARTQILAALTARPFQTLNLYSRTRSKGETMAAEIQKSFAGEINLVDSAEEAVMTADVLITATSSRTPVFDMGWLRPGTHINSIGPKFQGAHELPLGIEAVCDLLTTDSLAQVKGYARPHFIADLSNMIGLEQIVVGKHPGRTSNEQITLFNSTGLAGTEVLLGDYLIQKFSDM